MQEAKNAMYGAWKDAYVSFPSYHAVLTLAPVQNVVAGVSHTDQFEAKGFITPEQFVAAGDMLTGKCRTWTWSAIQLPNQTCTELHLQGERLQRSETISVPSA